MKTNQNDGMIREESKAIWNRYQDQISSTSLSSIWSVSVLQNHSLEQCMQISHLDYVVDRIRWLDVPSARSLWVHHAMAIVAVVITTLRHQM